MVDNPSDVHLYDEDHHLYMTGLYMPPQSVFGQLPQSDLNSHARAWARVPDDEGLARVLTAITGGLLQREIVADSIPGTPPYEKLESWVLRPTTDRAGRLDAWFVGEPLHTRYRVLVHHAPRRHGSLILPLLWDEAYRELEAIRPSRPRRYVSTEALRSGVRVLEDYLAAYRTGPDAVRHAAESLGHPIYHLQGGASA